MRRDLIIAIVGLLVLGAGLITSNRWERDVRQKSPANIRVQTTNERYQKALDAEREREIEQQAGWYGRTIDEEKAELAKYAAAVQSRILSYPAVLTINSDGTASVRGPVERNVDSGCEGDTFLLLEAPGTKIEVVYDQCCITHISIPAKNQTTEVKRAPDYAAENLFTARRNIEPMQMISAFGKYELARDEPPKIIVYGNPNYYVHIEPENAP